MAGFIGLVGILSVVSQTGILLLLTKSFGTKHTITLGLCFQLAQLLWYTFTISIRRFRYGLGTQYWMMWAAGLLAAMSQLTYPSISAFVSILSDRDKQGTVQGVITGIRGLCQGIRENLSQEFRLRTGTLRVYFLPFRHGLEHGR